MLRNALLASKGFEKEETYWSNKLSKNILIEGFPSDYKSLNEPFYEKDSLFFAINPALCKKINEITNNSEYGIYIFILTGVIFLLSKYSGNEDVIIGSPVFKQDTNELYINDFLLLRNVIKNDMTFKDLLLNIKEIINEANENMNYPLISLMESYGLFLNKQRTFLPVLVYVENIHDDNIIKDQIFDIIFSFKIIGGSIEFQMIYNQKLYKESSITRIGNHLLNIFEKVLKSPLIKISEIDILSEGEKNQMLLEFNKTESPYPKEQTIISIFQEQVKKTPNLIAISFENYSLTYFELDQKSNQFAAFMGENGVKKGDIVGLLVHRSHYMVIGILGILKVNAICIPLDIRYPKERIEMILNDSQIKVLISQDEFMELNFPGKIINVKYLNEMPADYQTNFNYTEESSGDLAYIIYTSGSTGKPKGVMLHHYGINNHTYTKIKVLELHSGLVFCHNLNISFVASIWQIFAPLFCGAKLIIYSEQIIQDPYRFFEQIDTDSINILEIVPSVLNTFLQLIENGYKAPKLVHLNKLILTGEKITPDLVNRFYKIYQTQLINAYGQSECSDDTLHYYIPYNQNIESVPIGKPSNNTKVYVLDKNYQLQPFGVIGELYITSDGLAMGYLNNTELTNEKFIYCHSITDQRLYKTGDLVKQLSDGTIEFIGRNDRQVKIRGHRIDLNEIEFQLLKHDLIKEVVINIKEDNESGTNTIYAYYVSTSELTDNEIRNYLNNKLPQYMIPQIFIKLDKIPLTSNGKADILALPTKKTIHLDKEYVSPKSDVEIYLIKIWQEILNFQDISLNDSFFGLGGDSLKATLLIHKINKDMGTNISLTDLFRKQTTKELVEIISEFFQESRFKIFTTENLTSCSLTSAQERLYILNQTKGIGTTFNITLILKIEGVLNLKKLESSFQELIERHKILRVLFKMVNGEVVQEVNKNFHFQVDYSKEREDEIGVTIKKFVQPFNLEKEPPFKVKLVEINKNEYILMIDIHHIIADGFSITLLIKELIEHYQDKNLPELPIQYFDYVKWINQQYEAEFMLKQRDYWLNLLSGNIPTLNMPTDYPRTQKRSFSGDRIVFTLDFKLKEEINKLVLETDSTLFMVLMAIFNILLSKYSNQVDIIIGSPVIGRPHADLDNLIGLFTNTVLLRNYPEGGKTFKYFLTEVRENTLKAFENQDYPYGELIKRLNINTESNRNPLFDVSFILNNIGLAEIEILKDLKVKPYPYENKTARHDLVLEAIEQENNLTFTFEYCSDLYQRKTVERMAENFITIAQKVIENPKITISEIGTLSEEKKKALIADFND